MCIVAAAPAAAAAAGAGAGAGTAAATSAGIFSATNLLYASLALTALQTGLGVVNAGQQANAQAQYAKQVQKSATKDYLNRTAAENTRLLQENEAAAQQVQQAQTKALQQRATARVASGEAGVAGISVDALINDFSRTEGLYREAVMRNLDFEQLASRDRMKAYKAEAEGRIASVPPVEKPNYLGILATGAAQGVGDYLSFRAAMRPNT
jgi:hypothetical protein